MIRFRPLIAAPLTAILACAGDPITAPITSLPRPLTREESQLVQVGNAFTFRLFREALRQEQAGANVFVSPLSVGMALGMTYNGANGATETAMQQTLGLSAMSREDINASYRGLIDLLRGLDRNVAFTIANSIWYRNTYTFTPTFLETNRTFFDAEVQGLDFASPGASGTINGWVSNRTSGRIPEIVPQTLPADAVMYLINAIYFKANWATRFDPSLTQPEPFHLADGSTAQLPTMAYAREASLRHYADTSVTVIDLPYGGGAWSMAIVLPRPGLSVDSVVAHLTADRWSTWIDGLDSTQSLLHLPRFTMRYDLGADAVLKALGLGPAYCDVGVPDFTRMDPSGQACISRVKHKTFVLVDESGTEAAAATSVEVGVTSVPMPLLIDRPFLFAIRERLSGTILFVGRMMNPAAP